MIRPRNQNKLQQPVQNKPKRQKKPKRGKKQVETDIQEQPNKIQLIKRPVNNPPKPSKPLLNPFYESDNKDQVEEYEDQIITYVKGQQAKYKVDQNYLKYHSVINLKIRNFLVKYIFKMTWRYKCKRSTLYLAVYCLDLYLSKTPNFHNNMETIAVAQAALHMAMKYEEIYPPSLKQWTPHAEQIKKILEYEAEILKTIDFKLNLPSIYYFEQYFQKRFCETNKFKQNKENLFLEEMKIQLISDLCLFDISLYEYPPFQLAKNIRMLVYNIELPFNEERVVLNIKWSLERNKVYLDWLKDYKYKQLNLS